MKQYRFKTNINCGGCVAQVKPHLDATEDISRWWVDTQNPQKLLTVETQVLTAEAISQLVHKAGFRAEAVQ